MTNRFQAHIFWLSLVILTVSDWLPDLSGEQNYFLPSQLIRLTMLALWCVYLLKSMGKRALSFDLEFSLKTMLFVLLFYALLEKDPVGGVYIVSRIAYWIIGVMAMYRLTYCKAIDVQNMNKYLCLIIFLSFAISIFYFFQFDTSTNDYNANAYWLLVLLPLVMINFKRSLLSQAAMILGAAGVCITVKRGAIIALVLSCVTYLTATFLLEKKFFRNLKYLLIVIIPISAAFIWQYDRVMTRFAIDALTDPERGASGRYWMWSTVFDEWKTETSIINYFFGFGSRGVSYSWEKMGISDRLTFAHSDIVEFFYDYGLFGILILILIHSAFIRSLARSFSARHYLFPAQAMSYVIFICASSYSIFLISPTALMLFAGYAFMEVTVKQDIFSRSQAINSGFSSTSRNHS